MASVRFADVQFRPTEFLDFTSLTLDEFRQLVPPFEAAFQAHMAVWCLDGKPRTARRFSMYQNCPLPTPGSRTSELRIMCRDRSPAVGWRSISQSSVLETRFQDLILPAWPASEHTSTVQHHDHQS